MTRTITTRWFLWWSWWKVDYIFTLHFSRPAIFYQPRRCLGIHV